MKIVELSLRLAVLIAVGLLQVFRRAKVFGDSYALV